MSNENRSKNDADAMFLNLALHAELADLRDGSLDILKYAPWSFREENDYLLDLLDWEYAPTMTIQEMLPDDFQPLDPAEASDEEIAIALKELLRLLKSCNQVAVCTNHLSDRRLYEILVKQTLPCKVKKLARPKRPALWNFCNHLEDGSNGSYNEDNWVSYYADDLQRLEWSLERRTPPPPKRAFISHRDDPALLNEVAFF